MPFSCRVQKVAMQQKWLASTNSNSLKGSATRNAAATEGSITSDSDSEESNLPDWVLRASRKEQLLPLMSRCVCVCVCGGLNFSG